MFRKKYPSLYIFKFDALTVILGKFILDSSPSSAIKKCWKHTEFMSPEVDEETDA